MTKNRALIGDKSVADWKKSEHHGAGTWLAERLSSLALVPLTGWSCWAALRLAGGGYDRALDFVRTPLNAGLISLTVVLAIWHMHMGLRTVIEDYFSKEEGRGFYLLLNFLLSLGLLCACLGGVFVVYQGGRT